MLLIIDVEVKRPDDSVKTDKVWLFDFHPDKID